MKPIDATRMKLAAMELVEGTDLDWPSVMRHKPSKQNLAAQFELYLLEDIELALSIIEGKPVWKGDELYNSKGRPFIVKRLCNGGTAIEYEYVVDGYYCEQIGVCTWFPPKPKTAMVELLVEDIEYWKKLGDFWDDKSTVNYRDEYMRKSMEFYAACRKTLEGLK